MDGGDGGGVGQGEGEGRSRSGARVADDSSVSSKGPSGFLGVRGRVDEEQVGKRFQLRGSKIHLEVTVEPNWLCPGEGGD